MTNHFIYDTETTGFYKAKSWLLEPSQPHLIQVSVLVTDPKTIHISQSISLIVRPEGWDIPDHVVKIHGITTEQAKDEGQPLKTVLEILLGLWAGPKSSSAPLTRVAHNAPFDRGIIATAIARTFGEEDLLAAWLDGSDYCTMEAAKSLKIGGTKRAPSLAKTYKHLFGTDFDKAHSANADAIACMKIWLALQKENEVSPYER